MLDQIKDIIDYLSAPTISFTLLTVLFPFSFHLQIGLIKLIESLEFIRYGLMSGFFIFILTTLFFYLVLMMKISV